MYFGIASNPFGTSAFLSTPAASAGLGVSPWGVGLDVATPLAPAYAGAWTGAFGTGAAVII
jgi:hypothetical protein